MIIQMGTEVDESRILWKHKESDEWKRADIDDLIRAYEDSERTGEWIFKTVFPNDKSEFPLGYLVCPVCGSQHANATPCNYCDNCGAKMGGDAE